MKRPPAINPIDANVMRRLDALEWLIDNEYEGKPKLFEDRTGIKMAQVGQWFSGYRALREKALRRLEECTGKPEGWFDEIKGAASITLPSPTISASGGPNQVPALMDSAQAAINNRASIQNIGEQLKTMSQGRKTAILALLAEYEKDPERITKEIEMLLGGGLDDSTIR